MVDQSAAGSTLTSEADRGNPPPPDRLPAVHADPPAELASAAPASAPNQPVERPNAQLPAGKVVTTEDVLNTLRTLIVLKESPPGSNMTPIGAWYGSNGVPWCAETVSYALYNGGFNDGQGNIAFPGATTPKGWAYVPFLERAFRNAGAFDQTPRVGSAVIFAWNNPDVGDHTGLVESINDDGTLNTIEGNADDSLIRKRRDRTHIRGFCHPSYNGAPSPQPPAHSSWPGRMIMLTTPDMQGPDVRTWQQQMASRGWVLSVDGDYGPQSHDACVRFQRDNGLNADGVVGPITWEACWK
jgi:hypothetical protein